MLKLIWQLPLLILTSAPVFIVIGACSFIYYVGKHHPSAKTMQSFLSDLRFPTDRMISFLPAGRLETAVAELESNPPDYGLLLRIISAGFLILQIALFVWLLSLKDDAGGTISAVILLTYIVFVSARTWFFGHKLKQAREITAHIFPK